MPAKRERERGGAVGGGRGLRGCGGAEPRGGAALMGGSMRRAWATASLMAPVKQTMAQGPGARDTAPQGH